MMKLRLPALVLGSLVMATSTTPALAMGHEINDIESTCAIFKNNKLVKKTKCLHDRQEWASSHSSGIYLKFQPIAGFGVYEISNTSNSMMVNHRTGEIRSDGQADSLTLNGKAAKIVYRHPTTYKVITKLDNYGHPYPIKNKKGKVLDPYQCYQSLSGVSTQFCYLHTP